jgi:hypothetical protein
MLAICYAHGIGSHREVLPRKRKQMNEQETSRAGFSEALTFGESLLAGEYDSRLSVSVLGRRPYSSFWGAQHIQERDDNLGPLSSTLSGADRNRIRATITSVLDKLLAQKGGLVMSEPNGLPQSSSRHHEGDIRYRDIVLRLKHGYDWTDSQRKYRLWVECWFYSPDVLQLSVIAPLQGLTVGL